MEEEEGGCCTVVLVFGEAGRKCLLDVGGGACFCLLSPPATPSSYSAPPPLITDERQGGITPLTIEPLTRTRERERGRKVEEARQTFPDDFLEAASVSEGKVPHPPLPHAQTPLARAKQGLGGVEEQQQS